MCLPRDWAVPVCQYCGKQPFGANICVCFGRLNLLNADLLSFSGIYICSEVLWNWVQTHQRRPRLTLLLNTLNAFGIMGNNLLVDFFVQDGMVGLLLNILKMEWARIGRLRVTTLCAGDWSRIQRKFLVHLCYGVSLEKPVELCSDTFNNNCRRFCIDDRLKRGFCFGGYSGYQSVINSNLDVFGICNPPFISGFVKQLGANLSRAYNSIHRAIRVVLVTPRFLRDVVNRWMKGAFLFADLSSMKFVSAFGGRGYAGRSSGFRVDVWLVSNRVADELLPILPERWLECMRWLRHTMPSGSIFYPHLPCFNNGWICKSVVNRATNFAEFRQVCDDIEVQHLAGKGGREGTRSWKTLIPLLHRGAILAVGCLERLQRLQLRLGFTIPDSLDAVHACVYVIFNAKTSFIYVGCTSVGMISRYKQHVWRAESELFAGRKRRYATRGLYDHMNKVGRHFFFVVPLEVLNGDPPVDYILARERWWMEKCGGVERLLNIALGRGKQVIIPASLTLYSQRLGVIHPLSRLPCLLKRFHTCGQLAEFLMGCRRIDCSPEDLLVVSNLLYKEVSRESWLRFWRWVKYRFRLWRKPLPSSMAIRVAVQPPTPGSFPSNTLDVELRKIFREHIMDLNVHKELKLAYCNLLTIVHCAPVTVKKVVAKPGRLGKHLHVMQLRGILHGKGFCMCKGRVCSCGLGCSCDRLSPWTREQYDGHVCVKGSELLDLPRPRSWFEGEVRALGQALGNVMQTPLSTCLDTTASSIVDCNRVLHGCVGGLKFTLGKAMMAVRKAFDQQPRVPKWATEKVLKSAMRKLPSGVVVGPLDKNSNVAWISCWKLLARFLYQTFFVPGNFKVIDMGVESMLSMFEERIRPVAREFGTILSTSLTDRIMPILYLLWKDKEVGVIKMRPITSHRTHPLRQVARRIGRGLSTLLWYGTGCIKQRLSLAKRSQVQFFPQDLRLIPCLECCDMALFVKYIHWVKAEWKGLNLMRHRMCAVEIDLDNMYTNIPKDAAWKAIQWFLSVLHKRWRRNWVAVHKFDKRMDRVGQGCHRDFVNYSFTDILKFVYFDIFQNCLASCGSVAFSQETGLPMGGCLSAQIACIFCIYREHMFFQQLQDMRAGGVAWLSRFRDNIFVIYQKPLTDIPFLLKLCSRVYGMGVKIEREGRIIDTLVYRLSLDDPLHLLALRTKPQTGNRLSGPDTHSLSVNTFLRSYVPQCVLKAFSVSEDRLIALVSLKEQLLQLFRRGYSKSMVKRAFNVTCFRYEYGEWFRKYGNFLCLCL